MPLTLHLNITKPHHTAKHISSSQPIYTLQCLTQSKPSLINHKVTDYFLILLQKHVICPVLSPTKMVKKLVTSVLVLSTLNSQPEVQSKNSQNREESSGRAIAFYHPFQHFFFLLKYNTIVIKLYCKTYKIQAASA